MDFDTITGFTVLFWTGVILFITFGFRQSSSTEKEAHDTEFKEV